MKKNLTFCLALLFGLPVFGQTEFKKIDLKTQIQEAQKEMTEQLRVLGIGDEAMKPLLDTAWISFDFHGLGEDDHIVLPPAESPGFSEMLDNLEQQLQHIDGIDTNALWQMMQRMWHGIPELNSGQSSPAPPAEGQPADKPAKKRTIHSM